MWKVIANSNASFYSLKKIIIIKMLLHFDFFWQLKKENNLKSADFIYIDIKCSIYCPH